MPALTCRPKCAASTRPCLSKFPSGSHKRATTAAQRVANAFSPTWVRRTRPVSPATLDAQIEEAHRQIAMLQDTRCQAVAANPDTAADYDRYIAEHRADIDFYRWLRRLVDVGGVFHVPANGKLTADAIRNCPHCIKGTHHTIQFCPCIKPCTMPSSNSGASNHDQTTTLAKRTAFASASWPMGGKPTPAPATALPPWGITAL